MDADDGMTWLDEKSTGLRAEAQQHVHRDPAGCSVETLFDPLGAFEASDRCLVRLLEGQASADARPDETAQRHFVACVNKPRRRCGVELRKTGSEGGYPTFSLALLHAATKGHPKNLIFASSDKPDLR